MPSNVLTMCWHVYEKLSHSVTFICGYEMHICVQLHAKSDSMTVHHTTIDNNEKFVYRIKAAFDKSCEVERFKILEVDNFLHNLVYFGKQLKLFIF